MQSIARAIKRGKAVAYKGAFTEKTSVMRRFGANKRAYREACKARIKKSDKDSEAIRDEANNLNQTTK